MRQVWHSSYSKVMQFEADDEPQTVEADDGGKLFYDTSKDPISYKGPYLVYAFSTWVPELGQIEVACVPVTSFSSISAAVKSARSIDRSIANSLVSQCESLAGWSSMS